MALSADTRPHFATIADFIATMDKEIIHLFRDVLLVCDDLGLIGKERNPKSLQKDFFYRLVGPKTKVQSIVAFCNHLIYNDTILQ